MQFTDVVAGYALHGCGSCYMQWPSSSHNVKGDRTHEFSVYPQNGSAGRTVFAEVSNGGMERG